MMPSFVGRRRFCLSGLAFVSAPMTCCNTAYHLQAFAGLQRMQRVTLLIASRIGDYKFLRIKQFGNPLFNARIDNSQD